MAERAVQSATAAIQAERTGDLRRALSLYTEAATGLIAAAKVETNEARRLKIHESAADALRAAERVRAALDAPPATVVAAPRSTAGGMMTSMTSGMAPLGPSSAVRSASARPSSGPVSAPPPLPARPSSAAAAPVGVAGLAAVTALAAAPALGDIVSRSFDAAAAQQPGGRSLATEALTLAGRGLVSAARTAYDLDQEYDIHNRVGAGLRTGLTRAAELEREYHVRERVSAAVDRARELNERHQIDQKVTDVVVAAGKAVATGAVMAKEFNEKHKVTDRVIEGAKTGLAKARELNAEYKITDRLASAASAAVAKAQALNQEYAITDKLGALALRGLDSLAGGARQASAKLDEQRQQVEQRRGPGSG